jgi:hypothetical protein
MLDRPPLRLHLDRLPLLEQEVRVPIQSVK